MCRPAFSVPGSSSFTHKAHTLAGALSRTHGLTLRCAHTLSPTPARTNIQTATPAHSATLLSVLCPILAVCRLQSISPFTPRGAMRRESACPKAPPSLCAAVYLSLQGRQPGTSGHVPPDPTWQTLRPGPVARRDKQVWSHSSVWKSAAALLLLQLCCWSSQAVV